MKSKRTLTVGMIAAIAPTLLAGCGDSRPPYFSEQPSYSDPSLLNKPSYFNNKPDYDYRDTHPLFAPPQAPSN